MKTLLKNATVLTMEDKKKILFNTDVLVENDKIVRIGKINDKAEKIIDFEGDILMPSFINGHSHSAMTLFRSVADDTSLQTWLFDNIIPMENHLIADDVYYGTLLAILEYISGGITTFCDMYYFPEMIAKATTECGLNTIICGGTIENDDNKKVRELEENYNRFNSYSQNVKYMLGVHAEYTSTEKFLELVSDLSIKYKAPTYIHASETLTEVGECTVRHNGLTPPLYLDKLGFFDNGGAIAHGTYLDKDDIAILKQRNVAVISNPASNLKLAGGIAPIFSMVENGLTVGLGTDGAASNNSLDMFREMYLVSVLQKYIMRDASVIPAFKALQMATSDGYKAFGISNKGKVKEGFIADLIRINTKSPQMNPLNNVEKSIVFSANKSDVLMTMSGGKILYENGKFTLDLDVNEIFSKCKESVQRIKLKL